MRQPQEPPLCIMLRLKPGGYPPGALTSSISHGELGVAQLQRLRLLSNPLMCSYFNNGVASVLTAFHLPPFSCYEYHCSQLSFTRRD